MDATAYTTPAIIVGVLVSAALVLRSVVDLRSVMAVPARKEHITRAEYDKDERLRKERLRDLAVKCRRNTRRQLAERVRTDEKFDALIGGLTELKVQLARLTTWLEHAEPAPRSVHVVSARPVAAPPPDEIVAPKEPL